MANTNTLLTAEEVAGMIQVSPAWVQEQARRGEIPALKLGRWWRFERGEVEHWLRSHQSGAYKQQIDTAEEIR